MHGSLTLSLVSQIMHFTASDGFQDSILFFQVHNSIRPYACTYCEAKFARVSHLNRHIRTHTGERPFACERCGKSFARQDKLKLHMDRHLTRENKTDIITQFMSPSKKIKLEQASFKQESGAVSNSSTPSSGMMSPAPAMGGYTMMTQNTGAGLWGAFPALYSPAQQSPGPAYQAVYPGMVPGQYTGAELHNVMKIGECSIKPLGSQ